MYVLIGKLKKGRERRSHWLVHSPKLHNTHSWTGQSQETALSGSPMFQRAIDIPFCVLRPTSIELDVK